MKLLLLSMAFVMVLSAGLIAWLEQPAWLPDEISAEPQQKVLVFLVGDPRGIENVRRAIDPGRLLYASADAIVLVEGRIVATDVTAVSGPINDVGWRDRPLEIFHVERADPFGRTKAVGADGAEVDPERLARLRDLVKKPTLSYGEQLFVLQAMNDGVAF